MYVRTIEVQADSLDEAQQKANQTIADETLMTGYQLLSEKIISDGATEFYDTRTIVAYGESLENARNKISAQIPEQFVLISENIISDGEPEIAKGSGSTTSEAFYGAENKIPKNIPFGIVTLEKRIVSEPEIVMDSFPVKEFGIEAAQAKAKEQIAKEYAGGRLKNIDLVNQGSNGFLGFGRKPNWYKVEVEVQVSDASVEITYKRFAEIEAQIGVKNLMQQAIIQVKLIKTNLDVESLFNELKSIALSEGFLTVAGDVCARCSSKVTVEDVTVKCSNCGLEQNKEHYNHNNHHIVAREIGEVLNAMGGFDLMQKVGYRIRESTRQGPHLERCWNHIGDWLA